MAGYGDVVGGVKGLVELAAEESESNYVVSAIVGAAGLLPTLAALKKGKQVGIANKEPLVMAGPLMLALAAAREFKSTILPIDSEHSAIFQSARAGRRKRDSQDCPDRFRRTVQNHAARRDARRDQEAGAETSDVVDGGEDHYRFGHADE